MFIDILFSTSCTHPAHMRERVGLARGVQDAGPQGRRPGLGWSRIRLRVIQGSLQVTPNVTLPCRFRGISRGAGCRRGDDTAPRVSRAASPRGRRDAPQPHEPRSHPRKLGTLRGGARHRSRRPATASPPWATANRCFLTSFPGRWSGPRPATRPLAPRRRHDEDGELGPVRRGVPAGRNFANPKMPQTR